MNKIAAYEIALQQVETEKRAQYLTEAYGTMQGDLPPGYMQAFDEMEKEAIISGVGRGLASIGSGITGGVARAGKALSKGTDVGSLRNTLGTAMERGAKGIYRAGGDSRALLGATAVGTGLAAGGAGLMAGRYIVPKQRQQQQG